VNRVEHLLTIIAEESAEVSQRATKALRFGLDEVQQGQPHNNADRMLIEFADLLCSLALLEEADPVFRDAKITYARRLRNLLQVKRIKIEEFLCYSADRGKLT
jgi:hypothetical protein